MFCFVFNNLKVMLAFFVFVCFCHFTGAGGISVTMQLSWPSKWHGDNDMLC